MLSIRSMFGCDSHLYLAFMTAGVRDRKAGGSIKYIHVF